MPEYDCRECGATNEIDPAVVSLCATFWEPCPECGERNAFDFRGAP